MAKMSHIPMHTQLQPKYSRQHEFLSKAPKNSHFSDKYAGQLLPPNLFSVLQLPQKIPQLSAFKIWIVCRNKCCDLAWRSTKKKIVKSYGGKERVWENYCFCSLFILSITYYIPVAQSCMQHCVPAQNQQPKTFLRNHHAIMALHHS